MPEDQSLSPSEAAIKILLEAIKQEQTLSDETREALVQDLTSENPTKLPNLAAIGGKL